MSQPTEMYKRSLSGSVGAGVGALFNGKGRTYYILEHKVSSKYHKAGESQEIIVDQIELGRDPKCQVRFDESFQTVSRRHAAIVRDGERWKLIQLSHTNTTLLNGHPIKTEWYLQNGDEIQLSVNGPRLGFIVPTGNRSTVGSIGLSRRLSLFRQQALRPYKSAMTAMAVCFLLLFAGAAYAIYTQGKKINDYEQWLASSEKKIEDMEAESRRREAERRHREDSLRMDFDKRYKELQKNVSPDIASLVSNVKSSVYFLYTEYYVQTSEKLVKVSSSSGTGFLTNDGRFVTARHCVQPWLFSFGDDDDIMVNAISEATPEKVFSKMVAINSQGEVLNFTNKNFTVDTSEDKIIEYPFDNGFTTNIRIALYIDGLKLNNKKVSSTDWAYAQYTSDNTRLRKGNIRCDKDGSLQLSSGKETYVLGFPAGIGFDDDEKQNTVEPIYNKMNIARTGLNESGMIMVSQGVAHGNSGGPVFVVKNGSFYAVGIVSQLMSATQRKENGVIVQQQQQYDELVPIANIFKK